MTYSINVNLESFEIPVADTEIGRKFAEDGYFVAKSVFSKNEVAVLERDFDRIVDQISESGESINATWAGPEMDRLGAQNLVVLHTHNVQQYSAVWLRALLQDRFLKFATEILGPDVLLHHTKLFQKPPERGAPFPMHQDWDYFPTLQHSMIAGVIHVSDARDDMGCLRVFPGSHKLGPVQGTAGYMESDILSKYPLEDATPVEVGAGDVVFFHYFTIHGSMPNRSADTRKTVLVQLLAGSDAVVDGNQHPNERLVLAGWNHHATRSSVNT